jgi:hypothetical protein
VVSSLGLLYTTFATEEGAVMVPNSVVLNVAIVTQRAGAARGERTPLSGEERTP